MKRHFILIICSSILIWTACEQQQPAPRPSGLKNMAPPSKQESVQEGLDAEPNNTFLQAIDVTMTGDVAHWGGQLEADDVDVWHIKAKAGTIADILITPEADTDLIIDYAPTAQALQRRYYDVGGVGEAELIPNMRLTPQGGFISVRGRHTGEPVKYRLSVTRVSASDGGTMMEAEPNDVPMESLVVTMPNRVEGVVYPASDIDYWRVPIVSPSVIQFKLPGGVYEVAVEHQNKVIWSAVSQQAQVLKSDILTPEQREVYVRFKSLEAVKEARRYFFEVSALEKVPDEIEPNNTVETAQKIQGISQSLEFSLADSADIDIFHVSLAQDQVYSARLVGPEVGQARLQVLSSAGVSRGDVLGDGQAICDATVGEDQALWFKVMPGVGVTTWPLSYRIVMESGPAATAEQEPNQQLDQAQEIVPGATVRGHIFPVGDVDMYKIVLPAYAGVEGPVGTLRVNIEGGYVAQLRLMLQDSEGYEISQAQNVQYSRPMHLAFDAPNGVYMLAVSGAGDGCVKPYVLKVGFEPNAAALAALAAEVAAPVQGNDAVLPSGDHGVAGGGQIDGMPVKPETVDLQLEALIQAAEEAQRQDKNIENGSENKGVPRVDDNPSLEDEDSF